MAIARINSVLVKHSRVLFGVITIIIIISFVWFFTPGTSGSIFFDRGGSPDSVVGTVFGEKITLAMINDARRDMIVFQAAQYGAAPSMIRGLSIQEALGFSSMSKLADKMGISVSPQQVGEFIRQLNVFKGKDGKFSPEKFREYEKTKLNPENYTAVDLDKAVRRYLSVSMLSAVIGTPAVTDSELKAFERAMLEKFSVRTITFNGADFTKGLNPSQKDLENSFKLKQSGKNPAYKTRMQIQASVVRFPYGLYESKAGAAIKNSDIKKYYDSHKSAYMKGGKVQPFSAVSKTIRAKLLREKTESMALADASALREKLYDATSNLSGSTEEYVKVFADTVRKSSLKAVPTGWFADNAEGMNNVGKEPVLVAALAAAAKDRPITDPVKGTRAVYVCAVTKTAPVRAATFKEAFPQVRSDYIAAIGLKRANEAAAVLTAEMQKSKNPASDLAKLAKKGKIVKAAPFSEFSYAMEIPPEAFQLAKNTAKGKLSVTAPVSGGVMLVFVDDRVAPTADEIKKAHPMLERLYTSAKYQTVSRMFELWAARNTTSLIQER